VKALAWFLGVAAALGLVGVLVGFEWLGVPLYFLFHALDEGMPEDEDAAKTWIIVALILGAYSLRLLVGTLILYVSIFAGFKFFRWWEKRRGTTNPFGEDL
jgi:hypothetical protein